MGDKFKCCQIKPLLPASVYRRWHDSSDARGREEKNLHNDRPILVWSLSTNALNLLLAVLAQKVEAHTVALCLLHIVVETMAQHQILGTGQVAFEHAVLHPLARALQRAVYAAAPFVVFDIVA